MPRVERSVTIGGDLDAVFAAANDIRRWPERFAEYASVRVLREDHRPRFSKVDFELTNEQGQQWRSWRILDHEEHTAIAERVQPRFPFLFMHLTWSFAQVDAGVEMIWTQDFELDPECSLDADTVTGALAAHSEQNQARFRELLEREFGASTGAGTPA